MEGERETKPIVPVGVGGDIGMYALLRAFHERYQITGVVLSKVVTRFFQNSAIARTVVVPEIDRPEVMVNALRRVAAKFPGARLVLLTNADWYVRAIVEHRAELADLYWIPFCEKSTLDLISTKEGFAAVCDRIGLPTPRTVAVNISELTPADVAAFDPGLPFPIIGKPSSSADYYYVDFPGKAKIHHLRSRAELVDLLDRLVAAEYPGVFLLQEFIPGDETHMRSLTAYRDQSGQTTLLASGHVLLEEHTPGTLGVPAAIRTKVMAEAMSDVTRFLDEVDYHGYANFDCKVDDRSGELVFFEVNPRIGRNNYYATAAGTNVAEPLVADLTGKPVSQPKQATGEVLYTVVAVRLLRHYLTGANLAAVNDLVRAKAVVNPLRYRGDRGRKRRLIVAAVRLNYWRKFRRHYARPTKTGF
jgi:predicted ATP-grasp superfamily ATP-dependent carboligase